ncbi:MAG: UbiA prenyltransferase family protein [Chitinophagaceae bacterium]|nr:UbiA prenyltransferase family protein [Chitinophagaceae bacterium]
MPVYFFALSQVPVISTWKAVLVFIIIHFIMYPASNGYNSYMDRDEESIGMLEKPPPPTDELFYISVILDTLAIALSFLVNLPFALCIIANILASRAYSYRGIRLKKYPIAGFLTVIVFQGAITYYMVYTGASEDYRNLPIPWEGMIIASLLFGGFYPLTQIYQHKQDLKDGVRTISYVLGYTGTFLFSGIMYTIADGLLFQYFSIRDQVMHFWILQVFFLPVVAYFLFWWMKVSRNNANANFRYAMRMNIIASASTNIAFISFCLLNHTFREALVL